MIYGNGGKYTVLQGILVPKNESQSIVNYRDALKKLPVPYNMF